MKKSLKKRTYKKRAYKKRTYKKRTYKKRSNKNSLTTPIFFSKLIKNNDAVNNFHIRKPNNNNGSGILVPGLRQFL
jgi:hypothetical protein